MGQAPIKSGNETSNYITEDVGLFRCRYGEREKLALMERKLLSAANSR